MSGKSPYVTLAAAAALFVALIVVNLVHDPREDDTPGSEYGGLPAISAPTAWSGDGPAQAREAAR